MQVLVLFFQTYNEGQQTLLASYEIVYCSQKPSIRPAAQPLFQKGEVHFDTVGGVTGRTGL